MTGRTVRYVITSALTKRHEELSGEASPLDFDGASQIMKALTDAGYSVVHLDDIGIRVVDARRATAQMIRRDAVDEAVDGQVRLTALMRMCDEAGNHGSAP